ncbi:MAG: fasciclin domain-containing protein, partial [Thermoleophilia bacterium]|nr:fasciclin domain-containing protein [Thermoleophilia bacterium]
MDKFDKSWTVIGTEGDHPMRKALITLAVALVAIAAVVAPATASKQASDMDIVETAIAAGQFKTLASLLTEAGLVETLQGPGPFTVFAPTDAAFAKVPKATLDALAADPALLKKVLLYHVVAGNVPASEVVKLNGQIVSTANKLPIGIKIAGGNVFLNGSTKVITPDVEASNGTIHVINKVLLPPGNIVATATAAKSFKTLTSLVKKAGLAKTLQSGKWTVFAPTDAAFKKVPKATLNALAENK